MTWKLSGAEVYIQNIEMREGCVATQDGTTVALISISIAFCWQRVGRGQKKGKNCKRKHCYCK